MARKGHVTFGGQGQHEFYAPTTGQGQKNRRNRKKCKYYNCDTKYCEKLRTSCVGPTICGKYTLQENQSSNAMQRLPAECLKVGTIVKSQYLGEGKITSIEADVYTIEFKGVRIQRRLIDIVENFHFTFDGQK